MFCTEEALPLVAFGPVAGEDIGLVGADAEMRFEQRKQLILGDVGRAAAEMYGFALQQELPLLVRALPALDACGEERVGDGKAINQVRRPRSGGGAQRGKVGV